MSNLPVAILARGREKSLRRRHPWVFSGAIARVEGSPAPGTTVRVQAHDGEFLAWAAYSPASQIRLRTWSFDEHERVDETFFRRRLESAIGLRRRLGLLDEHGACRLVFSEADGLPGLIVDRYADALVCQFLSTGADHWSDTLVALLAELLGPLCIFDRSDAAARRKEALPARHGLLFGAAPDAPVEFVDHGVRLLVDVAGGQKTGAYLDQAVNRQRVGAHAPGSRVLDAYSYAGGFSLAALAAGAGESTLIDSSAEALALAERQAALNGVADRCHYLQGHVPDELRRLRDEGQRFGLVVLDPPKFVHSARQVQAGSRGYKDVNLLGAQLLEPGGILATFSCSGHVGADLFQKIVAGAVLDAGRDLQIIERLSQAPDHPVATAFPEADYLTGLVLRAVD